MTVYMGGDAPGQWDALAGAFTQQFPDVKLHLVTDLSKYHDARIDNQFANDNLVADVAILQTTQDFDRWKRQGELLQYRPVGSGQVFTNAKVEGHPGRLSDVGTCAIDVRLAADRHDSAFHADRRTSDGVDQRQRLLRGEQTRASPRSGLVATPVLAKARRQRRESAVPSLPV